MIRKYSTILTITFVMFTYGFTIPSLFFAGTIGLSCQYIFDRLLVTYYYKQNVLHNDRLQRSAIKVLKYAVCLFFVLGAATISQNDCTLNNNHIQPITNTNSIQTCHRFGELSIFMVIFSFIVLILLGISDFITAKRKKYSEDEITQGGTYYFSRLSNVDRKWWIAEELMFR